MLKNKALLLWVTLKVQYSGEIKSGLVWISTGQKEVGLQMIRILNGIWNPEVQPFEIRTNLSHFFENHFKSGQLCQDFKWSGFWMVGTTSIAIAKAWPFEIRPDFKCIPLTNGWISDPHCISIVSSLRLMMSHKDGAHKAFVQTFRWNVRQLRDLPVGLLSC